jgi:hypothetical protein
MITSNTKGGGRMFEQIKKIMEKMSGKKEIQLDVVPKSDENELHTNENNQGERVQLPCGE